MPPRNVRILAACNYLPVMLKNAFKPCIPTRGTKVPDRPEWLHEIKHDGYRLIVQRKRVRLFTRNGHDWTDRHPLIVEAALRNRGTWCAFKRERHVEGHQVEPVLVEVIGHLCTMSLELTPGSGQAGARAASANGLTIEAMGGMAVFPHPGEGSGGVSFLHALISTWPQPPATRQ